MSKPQAPVKRNQTIELSFEDMTHDGNGVGKINGYPIFVSNTLPGETAKVKVTKVKKNFALGKRLELLTESPDRVKPPCDVYHKCGGCQLQHMSYDSQLTMKQNQVKNALRRIAHIDDVTVEPTLGMDDPWSYRNKVQIPVGEKNGELITGFYRPRSHDIINDMKRCIITSDVNNELVDVVREIADELDIPAYDGKTHRGVLRHIVARSAENTGQTMVVIVTRTNKLPKQDEFIKRILEKQPNITSIMHNSNPNRTNVILGRKTTCLWGEEYIYDTIGDVKFAISALSFYQINPKQTEVLYDKALEYADLSGGETVLDAYCGIGSISLFLAQKAKKVYGIEIIPQAVQDAKKNAKLNGLDNTEFIVGQAEKVLPELKADGLKPDVIVVDPPRKGCDEALLDAMVEMNPKRIVYVSCNPSTLARDLVTLTEGGYKLKKVQPVDNFPQTSHVEAVTWLEQKF